MPRNYPFPFITKEIFEKSSEFKLFKKLVLIEFSWILDIESPNTEELNEWTALYVNVKIDIYKLQKLYNWKIESFVINRVEKQLINSESPYLEYFFSDEHNHSNEITNFSRNVNNIFPELSSQVYENIPSEVSNRDLAKRPFRPDQFIVPNASILPVPKDVLIKKIY